MTVSNTINWADFARIDIRVGTIVCAKPNASARKPALTLWIEFGSEYGEKKSSAQLTRHYTPENLIAKSPLC